MASTTSVKFLNARAPSAPTFEAAAGSLLAILDAFLVHGWAMKAIDSGTIAGGVCTLTFSSGVGPYEVNTVILVEGASPAGLDGEQRVIAVTPNSVSFATTLPDGAATGAITIKCAPAGWEKVYTKTTVAVYRSQDIASSRPYLRIDASNAAYARVAQYESMSNVDTGTGMIPLTGAVSGGYYWHHGSHANKDYFLAADSRTLYACFATSSGQNITSAENYPSVVYMAGDFNSVRSGDFYSCALSGAITTTATNTLGCVFANASSGLNNLSVQRAVHGFGAGYVAGRWHGTAGDSAPGCASSPFGPIVGSADNVARFSPVYLSSGGSILAGGVRGAFAGVMAPLNSSAVAVFGYMKKQHVGTGVLAGKTYYAIPVGTSSTASAASADSGLAFVDITGPWR